MERKELIELFDSSESIAEICHKLYGKNNGGMHNRVLKLFQETGYDWDTHMAEMREGSKRYCLNCGKELDPRERSRRKFCSQSCAAQYNNKLREHTDETKSAISEGVKKYWSEHQLSDEDRYNKYHKDKYGISYEEYLSRKERCVKGSKDVAHCVVCGKELEPRQSIFCSQECRDKHDQQLYEDYIERWKRGEESGCTPSYKIHKYVKRYLFEKNNNSCQECGWNRVNEHTGNVPLQIHHIDGDCTNNSEENLQLLCPNCHALTENFGSRNKNSKRLFRKQKLFKQEIVK